MSHKQNDNNRDQDNQFLLRDLKKARQLSPEQKKKSKKRELERKLESKDAKHYAKKKYKKDKKKTKLKNRALADKNQGSYKRIIRFSLYILIVILLLSLLFFFSNISNIYKNSEEWKKSSPVKISSIPPDILYMDSKQRKAYLNFYDHADTLWDTNHHDFKKGVNQDKINKLKDLYSNIKQPNDRAKFLYDEVNRDWKIVNEYEDIVNSGKIKEEVTLSDVKKFINNHAESVVNDLIQKGDHRFAKNMRTKMLKLSYDVDKVDSLLNATSDLLNIDHKNGNAKVKSSVLPGDVVKTNHYLSSMNYDWSYTETKLDAILNDISSISNKHDKDLAKYNEYISDQQDKENFESFKQSYDQAKKSLQSEIIDVPDFLGKDISKVKSWANEHRVKLEISTIEDDNETKDQVLEQTPSTSDFKRMLSSSTMKVTIAKEENHNESNSEDKDDSSSANEFKSSDDFDSHSGSSNSNDDNNDKNSSSQSDSSNDNQDGSHSNESNSEGKRNSDGERQSDNAEQNHN